MYREQKVRLDFVDYFFGGIDCGLLIDEVLIDEVLSLLGGKNKGCQLVPFFMG